MHELAAWPSKPAWDCVPELTKRDAALKKVEICMGCRKLKLDPATEKFSTETDELLRNSALSERVDPPVQLSIMLKDCPIREDVSTDSEPSIREMFLMDAEDANGRNSKVDMPFFPVARAIARSERELAIDR